MLYKIHQKSYFDNIQVILLIHYIFWNFYFSGKDVTWLLLFLDLQLSTCGAVVVWDAYSSFRVDVSLLFPAIKRLHGEQKSTEEYMISPFPSPQVPVFRPLLLTDDTRVISMSTSYSLLLNLQITLSED